MPQLAAANCTSADAAKTDQVLNHTSAADDLGWPRPWRTTPPW
jgi:hypothetical protein